MTASFDHLCQARLLRKGAFVDVCCQGVSYYLYQEKTAVNPKWQALNIGALSSSLGQRQLCRDDPPFGKGQERLEEPPSSPSTPDLYLAA